MWAADLRQLGVLELGVPALQQVLLLPCVLLRWAVLLPLGVLLARGVLRLGLPY